MDPDALLLVVRGGPQKPRAPTNHRLFASISAATVMLYRAIFTFFAVLAIAGTAAEEAPTGDPCLAEDYAEANCALPCPSNESPTLHNLTSRWLCLQTARAALRVATSSRDTGELHTCFPCLAAVSCAALSMPRCLTLASVHAA